MNLSPRSLVLLVLLAPLTSFGESYEWFDRIESTEGGPPDTVTTEVFQVAPSDYGTYSVGYTDCYHPRCSGLLSKYSNENGELLWRRKFTFDDVTKAYTLAVNAAGVFVAGLSYDSAVNRGGSCCSFVRLYSHDGDTLWTRRNLQWPEVAADSVADDTGVYVVGGKNNNRMVVHRLSNTGETLWTRVMLSEGSGNLAIELADNHLYVLSRSQQDIITIRASDGTSLGAFRIPRGYREVTIMSYHDGFLYLGGYWGFSKFSVAGDPIWRYFSNYWFPDPDQDGLQFSGGIVASDDGVFVSANFSRPRNTFNNDGVIAGSALMHFELDGSIRFGVTYPSIRDVVEYPGHWVDVNHLATWDGAVYAAGFHGERAAYTARYLNKPLVRPSLLALAGATPAMPPRLVVLHHDYGAGPMRVGIRDAAPGSLEYRFEFSEDLKPVAFDKVADLNGNGYEELVVMSRLPALAEVRDSLDGSLVSTIKLGAHLEPLLATVEQRDGTPPRLAVVARNRNTDNLLLRIYNLESGSLLASNFYHPGFDPVDVVALPDAAGSGARRYAVLGRNQAPGAPHKIELRRGDGNLLGNYWIGGEQDPLQLAVTGEDVNGLAVLRYAAESSVLDVLRVDIATSAQQRLRFSANLTPVAMLELPDINGNGAPQYAVYGDETGGEPGEPVKAETRDLATGALDHNVFTGFAYRPEDAAYVGPVPGFSDESFALLGFRHRKNIRCDSDTPLDRACSLENGGFRATLADVDGTKLFYLDFFAEP